MSMATNPTTDLNPDNPIYDETEQMLEKQNYEQRRREPGPCLPKRLWQLMDIESDVDDWVIQEYQKLLEPGPSSKYVHLNPRILSTDDGTDFLGFIENILSGPGKDQSPLVALIPWKKNGETWALVEVCLRGEISYGHVVVINDPFRITGTSHETEYRPILDIIARRLSLYLGREHDKSIPVSKLHVEDCHKVCSRNDSGVYCMAMMNYMVRSSRKSSYLQIKNVMKLIPSFRCQLFDTLCSKKRADLLSVNVIKQDNFNQIVANYVKRFRQQNMKKLSVIGPYKSPLIDQPFAKTVSMREDKLSLVDSCHVNTITPDGPHATKDRMCSDCRVPADGDESLCGSSTSAKLGTTHEGDKLCVAGFGRYTHDKEHFSSERTTLELTRRPGLKGVSVSGDGLLCRSDAERDKQSPEFAGKREQAFSGSGHSTSVVQQSNERHLDCIADFETNASVVPGTINDEFPIPSKFFVNRFKSENPSCAFLRDPTYTVRSSLPADRMVSCSVKHYDPARPYERCLSHNDHHLNEVESIESIYFHDQLMFLVRFKHRLNGKKYEPWLNFHVLKKLEPGWVLRDFLQGLYVFHSYTWARLVNRAKKLDASLDAKVQTMPDLLNCIPSFIREEYNAYRVERKRFKDMISQRNRRLALKKRRALGAASRGEGGISNKRVAENSPGVSNRRAKAGKSTTSDMGI